MSHDVVRYLDTPPDRATLERILDAIADEPQALVRTDDAKFKALGIAKSDVTTREQVIDVLLAHPEVMRTPGRVRRRPRGDRPPLRCSTSSERSSIPGPRCRAARVKRNSGRPCTQLWVGAPVVEGEMR